MEPFVWNDRLVKLEDGKFVISAKGDHSNFEYYDINKGEYRAFTGRVGCLRVLGLSKIDENRLKIEMPDGDYELIDDVGKSQITDMRIQQMAAKIIV